MTKCCLSVITPVYNEEKLLPMFLKEMTGGLEKICPNFELLIIENGSMDKTLKIAKRESSLNRKIKVFHLTKPSYGKALKYGLLRAKGEYTIIFNVDFWDMFFLKRCLSLLKTYDIIIGSKMVKNAKDDRPFYRRFITYFFNLFLKICFGFKGTDTHGLKGFKTETLVPILKECQTEGEVLDTELILRAQRKKLEIIEVPVAVKEVRTSRYHLLKRIPRTIKDLVILKRLL